MYESGRRGVLTPVYSDLIFKWFDFCNSLGKIHCNPVEFLHRQETVLNDQKNLTF